MVHEPHSDPDPGEDFMWPAGADLDSLADGILLGQITGVSQDKVPFYIEELKVILGLHFRPASEHHTIRVVRSKHVLWVVRDEPTLFPHLSALKDREILRVVSMLLRDMQQQILNNKNRGKFLVVQGVQ